MTNIKQVQSQSIYKIKNCLQSINIYKVFIIYLISSSIKFHRLKVFFHHKYQKAP